MLLFATTLSFAAFADYQPVTQEPVFREKVVDRALSWPGGFNVRFTRDGRIDGQFPTGAVLGSWRWQNGLFCREISINNAARPAECLGIEIDQNRVRFRRQNGGYFLPYFIGEKIDP